MIPFPVLVVAVQPMIVQYGPALMPPPPFPTAVEAMIVQLLPNVNPVKLPVAEHPVSVQ